ncbi:uromodulin-like 1 [Anomaloglossus baeobatrachus]|uniref:uromodulin-like 1 n=1 Tax=Anomaloglossus baeobatrachus TaxID=238106 RepID=UPI003F4F8A2A
MDKKAILYLTLAGMATGLGSAQMLGHMISPWSYHVCNHTVTVNISKVVAFQKPREELTWCMSWIPWKLCTITTYQSEYRTVYVPETSTVRVCCEGYEPVGHYCALSLKQSRASRPGICPDREDKENSTKCAFDNDCPGLQKCCISSNGSFCASPAPPALDRNTMKYWYNGTIIIKMGYKQLIRWDEGLINHTRLLHSMVTGEFWPLEAELFHISTKPAGTFSIVASVLIGIKESLPLMNITAKLDNVVIRLPEVISIEINDLNECLYPELSGCLCNQECFNVEGSFNCRNKNHSESMQQNSTQPGPIPRPRPSHPPPFSSHPTISPEGPRPSHPPFSSHSTFSPTDPRPSHPPFSSAPTTQDVTFGNTSAAPCNCSMFYNHSIYNVTSDGFHLHWNTDCPEDFTYNVQVSGKEFNQSKTITGTNMKIQGLQAGELYTAQVTFRDCNGLVQLWNGRVKTEAHILNATLKIENWNLTDSLRDPSSPEYTTFLEKFISEVKSSLSHKVPPGQVSVEVESLGAGSIIVYFRIIVNDSVNLTAASFSAFSDEFLVNPGSIVVTDLNECLTPADNDCHLYADCKNLEGSYTCQCHPSFVDKDPSRPGRNCEGVNPTSTSPDSSTLGPTSPPLPPVIGKDFTAERGSPINPVNTSHSTTSPHPGHPTNVPEFQQVSTPVTPITPSANVSGGPSSAQFVLSTPVVAGNLLPRPVNSTPLVPVLATSHNTLSGTLSPSVAKVSAPQISVVSQLKLTPPSSTSKEIIPALPVPADREISCSFPIIGANVGSANLTLSPLSAKTTSPKSPSPTLKDASTVICKTEKIGIAIEKAFLKMMSIAGRSLFLGSPECSINCSTDTHIYIEAGWKNCNTDVQSNQTHIVVNSTLHIDLSSTFQNVTPRVISTIRCVFHNEILWSSGYNPAGGIYTIIEKLEGDGTFIPEFQLFIGDKPIPQNFTLSATDDITVQIRIKTEESQYKVVISECWATPTENSNDLISFPFIKDSCALTNTFTTIHTNGISNNATFQTKIFSFVDNPIVYLHCRLHVCKEESYKTCKPTCNGFRLANTGENVFTGVTRMGPLRKAVQSHDQDSPPNSALGPGYIALIVIAVLLLVAMVVSILICWHERRTGNYNFKIKTQDAAYQVFSN